MNDGYRDDGSGYACGRCGVRGWPGDGLRHTGPTFGRLRCDACLDAEAGADEHVAPLDSVWGPRRAAPGG